MQGDNRPGKTIKAESSKSYWLIKSEGDCYSIDDLKKDKITPWSGVRNFQARNYMRDHMKVGDLAFFYHSSSTDKNQPNGIYGLAKVSSKPYADLTAFDPKDEHFDPKCAKQKKEAEANGQAYVPMWMLVDFSFVKKYAAPLPLAVIKNDPKLEGIMLAQKGSRLSIQPVSETHFEYITSLLEK
ncbi:MAG TPA: EVE domain-containing protein [Candidatus Paceibacterota bacterium]